MSGLQHYDVVIVGAGQAGLFLARQLLLYSNKTVLLLDTASELPGPRQKLGESTVQIAGFYMSKVLDLEEYLLREHFLKYNLRFYWKCPGHDSRSYEEYSSCYIKSPSNIAGYQVNRNTLEAELIRLNTSHPHCTLLAPISHLDVSISDQGPHTVTFQHQGAPASVTAGWLVDTSGRARHLARRLNLTRPSPIHHGSSWFWVDGIVNVEKLTDLSLNDIRLRSDRKITGHFPVWLATNHFVGEGFWFWVIPLQDRTSLGVVYDTATFPVEQVTSAEKVRDWVCREFPLFARDLPGRKILDHGFFREYSYDCAQILSTSKWAIAGEAGRFPDPLYSPGADVISLHDSLIADLIMTEDERELARKVPLYETLLRSAVQALIPGFVVSYNTLGDQEAFILKYTWELTVYFTFYVFPFINDLFTKPDFLVPFFSRFGRLAPVNEGLQHCLSAFYEWKKTQGGEPNGPVFFDFTQIAPLQNAETLFYRVGVSAEEACGILDSHLENIVELARFVVAYMASRVLNDAQVLTDRAFVEGIDVNQIRFDLAAWRERWDSRQSRPEIYPWSFDPTVLDQFHPAPLEVV